MLFRALKELHIGETWLEAAFYYNLKKVILKFDLKEAAAIENSQIKFQDGRVPTDLQFI